MVKKIFHFIVVIATAILLLLGGIMTVPRILGISPYTTLSGSMSPTFETGSVIFINTKDQNVAVGDIIAFEDAGYNEKVICHRVVGQDGSIYTTKGDANDVIDLSALEQDRIIGTYVFHIPGLGYLLEHKIPLICLYISLNLLEYAMPGKKKSNEEKSLYIG